MVLTRSIPPPTLFRIPAGSLMPAALLHASSSIQCHAPRPSCRPLVSCRGPARLRPRPREHRGLHGCAFLHSDGPFPLPTCSQWQEAHVLFLLGVPVLLPTESRLAPTVSSIARSTTRGSSFMTCVLWLLIERFTQIPRARYQCAFRRLEIGRAADIGVS